VFLLVAHDQILLTGTGAPGGGNRKSVLHKGRQKQTALQANAGLYNGVIDRGPLQLTGFSLSFAEDSIRFMQFLEN
jgi:hypothetical protein